MKCLVSAVLVICISIFYDDRTEGAAIIPSYSLDPSTLTTEGQGTCTVGEICVYDSVLMNLSCEDCNQAPSRLAPENVLDGDDSTIWASMPTLQASSITIELGQAYNISNIEVLFERPPTTWVLEYSVDNLSTFLPWVAVVPEVEACQNFSSYPSCAPYDNTVRHTIDILQQSFQEKPSALRFTFLQPLAAVFPDPREEFVGVRDIVVMVVCEDAITLFDGISNVCQGVNRVYNHPVVHHPALSSAIGSQVEWSHVMRQTILPPLGTWYLDDVKIQFRDGNMFNDSFTDSQLNFFSWSPDGGVLAPLPCANQTSEQVLLFSEQQAGVRRALLTGLQQEDYSDIEFVLGFLDPSVQCPSDLGEVELSICETGIVNGNQQCQLVGVYALNDCGDCVNQHLLRLRLLITVLRTTLLQLPPHAILIVANTTDLANIVNEQAEYNNTYFEWLLGLTAVERVHGFPSEYPPNITLPIHIASIEVPASNIILYERYCDLFANITKFDDIGSRTDEVSRMSQSLAESVSLLTNEASIFRNNIEVLERNLSALYDRLLDNLARLSQAVAYGNSSLRLIASRSYDDLQSQISFFDSQSQEASRQVTEFNEVVEAHTESLKNISDRLVLSREYLNAVINSSDRVIESSIDVSVMINQADMIVNKIQVSIIQANALVVSIEANLLDAQSYSNATKDILSISNELLATATQSLTDLQAMVSALSLLLQNYSNRLDNYLPSSYPSVCQLGPTEQETCLEGELHSKYLELNSTRIVSESMATRRHAQEFLDGLADLPFVDFSDINQTATNAISVGQETLSQLEQSGLVELSDNVEETRVDVNGLSVNVSDLVLDMQQTLFEAKREFNRSIVLESQVSDIEADFGMIQTSIDELEQTSNYTEEAINIIGVISDVQRTLSGVNTTLDRVENSVPSVRASVQDTIDTVSEAKELFDYSEEQVVRVEDFILRTQETLNQTRAGLSDTIELNNEILSDIETLLLAVDSTHDLLNNINSPALFEESGSVQPFISLQSPPGIGEYDDDIPFNSLAIYVTVAPNYMAPSLLFYAGPIIEEGSAGNASSLSTDDYMAIIDEGNEITFQWRIGLSSGMRSIPYSMDDQRQFYLRRTGSMYELSSGSGGTVRNFTLVNQALLFKQTPVTGFLVGGQPSNAQLAIQNRYSSLLGTLDMVLYNGELWSLWNYRERSETNFIGPYRRHPEAIANVVEFDFAVNIFSDILSFNGNGYLKPRQFVQFSAISRLYIYYRIESFEGLLLYLYDPDTSSSIEVAVYNGELQVNLKYGQDGNINYQEDLMEMMGALSNVFTQAVVDIRFGRERVGVNGMIFDFPTIPDWTRVEAWFGGVVLDQLPESFRPNITTKRLRGCIGVSVVAGSQTTNLFSDTQTYANNYLNTPVQSGVAATCYESSYSDEVSFNGTDYLSYNALEVAGRANGRTISTGQPQLTLALSFLPQQDNVMIFTAIDDDRMIVVEYNNQLVQATFRSGSSSVVLRATNPASLSEWHHLLLEIRTASGGLRLFVDNMLVDSSVLPGFTFSLPSSGSTPVLHMGGAPSSNTFVGCFKDFIYNLDAMKFFNSHLMTYRNQDGVSFFSCPSLPVKMTTQLPTTFVEPNPTTCGLVEPEVFNETIGGFHALSTVLSYNILPLQSSTWSFEVSLRRFSPDGHVISFPSNDVILSLSLEGGVPMWHLFRQGGSMTTSVGTFLTPQVWYSLQINCSVSELILSCVSYVDGLLDGNTITQGISREIFYPELPVVMGQNGQSRGFVGCLRNPRVNQNSVGYELEGLSTCEQCYVNITDGWGFTGSGYLFESVASEPESYFVGMQFRPMRDHGLLVYLQSPADSTPLFAVGLYSGELRVTNFTTIGSFVTLSDQLLCTADTRLNSFHFISLDVSSSSVAITFTNSITGSQSNMVVQTSALEMGSLQVYIGGVRNNIQEPSIFAFLLSERGFDLSSPVPNFVGCMNFVEVSGANRAVNNLAIVTDADQYENVLNGLCPS